MLLSVIIDLLSARMTYKLTICQVGIYSQIHFSCSYALSTRRTINLPQVSC